jgi:thiamine-monophosphate kinase
MCRDGARAGDDIYVTGTLGDAALAVKCLKQGQHPMMPVQALIQCLGRPQPRIEAGCALRHFAHSAIDISDGLLADLGHILNMSEVGASLELDRIPLSPLVASAVDSQRNWSLVVAGGDDYELCVILPPENRGDVACISSQLDLPITRIGRIEPQPGIRCVESDGRSWAPSSFGYDHFTEYEH